jgi:hypothetical protein
LKKTLSQIIGIVCAELNTPAPTVVIGSQTDQIQQMLTFARAVNDDLLAEHDWQVLQTRYSFTTSNGVSAYSWPTDVERWINGTFYDRTNRWEMAGPRTPRQWEWLITSNIAPAGPIERFSIFGDKIQLYPTPGATPLTFNCEYISNNVVLDGSTGAPKPDYTSDADICVFDHRVVVYGIKLKWLDAKGNDTTSALSDYRRALSNALGTDAPAPQVSLLPQCDRHALNIPDGSWQ